MKRFLTGAVLSLVLVWGAQADDLEDWVLAREDVKMSDLTVGDYKALAEIWSVQRQERWYVQSAAMGSFLLPGLGQFKVGDTVGGTLNLAAHVALVAGTIYGTWALLPADLQNTSLGHKERHSLMEDYLHNDPAKVAPALGVMAGGVVLSIVHSVWAAGDAKTKALANLESDAVTFEPALFDRGAGFRMRM